MSTSVVVAAPEVSQTAPLAALAAVAAGGYLLSMAGAVFAPVVGTVDAALDAGINAVVRRLEALERARLERERTEKAKQDLIVSRINLRLQAKADEGARNLEALESRSSRIRDEVLLDLAERRLELQRADYSDELAKAAAEAAAARDGRRLAPKHAVGDLSVLLGRLALLDPDEARRLLPLVEDVDPYPSDRIDYLALQLKISIGRAADALAKEIRLRDDLEAMRLRLEIEAPALAENFGRRLAAEETIDERAFDRLSSVYGAFQTVNEIQKSVPELAIGDIDSIVDKCDNFTTEDYFTVFSTFLMRQGYSLLDENGNQIENIGKKCFVGLDLGPDYQAMVQTSSDGKLAIKLVRVVGDEKELAAVSDYQRERDREAAKKWCSYCDELEADLRRLGVEASFKIAKDEDEEILVIVSEHLAAEQQRIYRKADEAKLDAQQVQT